MKRFPVFISLLFFVITCAFSCKSRVRTKDELIKYIHDPAHGLKKEVEIHQIKLELINQPWQLMSLNRLGVNKKPSKGQQKTLQELSEKYFFVLSLSSHGRELLPQLDFNTYSEMVQVLSFRMGTYCSALPDGKRSVEPSHCLFQPTFGMANANSLLLVFDKKKLGPFSKLKIVVKEFGLSTGNQVFEFSEKDVNALSSLTYSQLL